MATAVAATQGTLKGGSASDAKNELPAALTASEQPAAECTSRAVDLVPMVV